MFRNYLITAYRNIKRQKLYSFINIFGLAIGMACVILILLYIKHELSFDRFHENADCIYRVVKRHTRGDLTRYQSGTPAPLAPILVNELPEVIEAARVGGGWGSVILYGNKEILNNHGAVLDPNFFKIFTIPFISGNPETALSNTHSVVITKKLAHKLFGNEEPTGNMIKIGRETYYNEFTITGVIENPPPNSRYQFDYILSFMTLYIKVNEGNIGWGASGYETYVLLPKKYPSKEFDLKLSGIIKKYSGEEESHALQLNLQPLKQIHLNLDPFNKIETDRDGTHIYIFFSIAMLILLLACINFINLTTTQYVTREKEIGIRKVVGARRSQLVKQFLGESVFLSVISFILSIPLVELLLPIFNEYAGKKLSFIYFDNTIFLLLTLGLAIVVGILAGCYPALFISRFKTTNILRKQFLSKKAHSSSILRGILVSIQFAITIIFIICLFVMRNQLDFIRARNLGYNVDHLVVIPIYYNNVRPKYELFKTEILRNNSILGAAATSFLPSEQGYYQNVHFKGSAKGKLGYIAWISADYDFVNILGLKIIKGRDFSKSISTDKHKAYILSESAVNRIDWENPIGEEINIIAWGTVIGVINDLDYKTLRRETKTLALCIFPEGFRYLLVRIQPENINESITFMKSTWESIFPGHSFEYSFFDEDFDRLYKSEIQQSSIFSYIAFLAIFIACLGLLGLTYFTTERRTKEIGIRKVLGASVPGIVIMLSKNFLKWIIIANIIAWPVAYYVMSKWLENFAYRIDLSWWIFILAGLLALVIALLTVSFQAVKAARANPVDSLRYE